MDGTTLNYLTLISSREGMLPIPVQSVLSQNITLVYESLDLSSAALDRNRLREIGGGDAMIVDTEDVIAVVRPSVGQVIQIGDRRILMTMQSPVSPLAMPPLWIIADQLHGLVAGKTLRAYGFNFDILVQLGEESNPALQMRFIVDRATLEERIGGTIESVVPRFQYSTEGIRYDLVLEAQPGNLLKVHFNAHFQRNQLPPQDTLEREYRESFRRCLDAVGRLMGVQK